MKRMYFFQKNSKNSSRFVKLSFDKPAGFFAESLKFFCSKSEKWCKDICSFSTKIYWKCTLGHVDCLFDNPDEVFLPRSLNTLRSMNENDEKFYSFRKFFFLKTFLWTPRHQIRQPYRNFFARSRKSFTGVTDWIRFYVFQFFFLRLFPWTRKMQIRQPYWNNSVKVLKNLARSPKAIKKNI